MTVRWSERRLGGSLTRGRTRSSAPVLPKRSRAPGSTGASWMRSSPTKVPLRLSRSTNQSWSPRRSNRACMLDTHGSATWTWHSGERPSTVGTSGRKKTVPPQIPFTTKSSATTPHWTLVAKMIPYPPRDAEMPYCPTCAMVCGEGASRCPADGSELVQGDPLLGRILGDRYRILERIGTGGMGTVYRAEHVILRKRLAIKVLRPELSMDEGLVQRFQQEAIAASQVGQENIVDVTDFGRTPRGALYFVMEDLDGENLQQVLTACGPLLLARALLILSQLCRALTAAHGRGIVHRDLKPENVILLRRAA